MGRTLRNLEDVRAKQRYKDAIIIDCWEHLKEWYAEHGPSETCEIVFTEHAAHIQPLKSTDDKDYFKKFHYLSTHTFYGKGSWINSSEALNRAGFKGIIIRNWDAEEENQKWPKWTYQREEKKDSFFSDLLEKSEKKDDL